MEDGKYITSVEDVTHERMLRDPIDLDEE